MFIGTDQYHVYREALQFDLSGIPAGVTVNSASLGVFYDQACIATNSNKLCAGINHKIDAHRVTATWSTSSLQFDSTVLSPASPCWPVPVRSG